MSKRLQVLLEETKFREIQRTGKAHRMTVAQWVRQALRAARRRESSGDVEKKLAAIRRAMQYQFPTADIEQMNEEIERGYLGNSKP